MPIDVTCDECFTPHRVKSEHAGRRFKCRECGAGLVVPKKGQAPAPAAPPPATGRGSKPVAKSKKRRSSAKSRGPAWAQGKLVWIAGGGGLLLLLLLIWPSLLHSLSMPLALAGIALALWGGLKCLASAFEEDVTCGLMWLFVPLYNVFYMFTRWDRVGPYFLTFLGGLLLMWAPLYGVKLMADAQWAEMEQTFDDELSPDIGAPIPNDPGLSGQTIGWVQAGIRLLSQPGTGTFTNYEPVEIQ